MYDKKTYCTLILRGIIEHMDCPNDLEVTEAYSPKIQHPKEHPDNEYYRCILSIAAITKKSDVISELAMYHWYDNKKDLRAAIYVPEDLHFIAATEKVFDIAKIPYKRILMPQ